MTHYYNIIRNSVKTLILAVLSLLQTRQGSNHMKGNIMKGDSMMKHVEG